MVRIAICDDNEIERTLLKKIITSIFAEMNHQIILMEFSSGEKLQRNFSRGDYDIIFLDINMSGKNGIEVGHAIRAKDKQVEIVFETGSDAYMKEGFGLHAMSYILKPYDVKQIKELITYYFEKNDIEPIEDGFEYLKLSIHQKEIVLKQKEIMFLESEGRVVNVYHSNNVYRVYERLGDIENRLDMDIFLRCNQSYIINVAYVDRIVDYDFHLKSSQRIPIRKRDKKDIIHKYYTKKSKLAEGEQ